MNHTILGGIDGVEPEEAQPRLLDCLGSHPPLYYLALHIFRLIFGNSVFSLRTFSVLGAVALAAWGIGPVKRALGNRVGIIYTIITFALPITLSMAQETRMYTWAAFWVTGSALYGFLAYKEGHLRDWIFSAYVPCTPHTRTTMASWPL